MSINGVLEDLPLADVLQFVHLGRRTGTLSMWRREDDARAEIGFHDGKIVSAWTPQQRRLGQLLLDDGLIEAEVLEAALAEQRGSNGQRSLGQVLLEREAVERASLHQVIRQQVEKTIYDLVTWRHGEFHFEVDELHPVDDFSLAPGEVLDDLDLDTQMLLMEAIRLFDERNRSTGGAQLDRQLELAGMSRGPRTAEPGQAAALPSPAARMNRRALRQRPLEVLRCQVVSDDASLVDSLREELPSELVRVATVRLREAGTRLPGEGSAPIVLYDARGRTASDEASDPAVGSAEPLREAPDAALASLSRTRPTAPVVALIDADADAAPMRRAGAVAVLRDGEAGLCETVQSLLRVSSDPQPQGTFGYAAGGGFGRFRRVVSEVQSGLLSATMALNLMHVISESVERAILFLVQDDSLVACGAFGFTADSQPLAQASRSLSLPLDRETASSILGRAIEQGTPISRRFDAAELPSRLVALLGRPASGQTVVFPVLGNDRPIALVYTDNGDLDEAIEDIRILELATAQVGVALEDELIRQRLGQMGLESALFETDFEPEFDAST